MKRRGFFGLLAGCIGIPFIYKGEDPNYISIKSVPIKGTPRKLKAKWTKETHDYLTKCMMEDIQNEIDREVIFKMVNAARMS